MIEYTKPVQCNLDEFDALIVRTFLASKWIAFQDHCAEHNVDPEEIYRSLGGES